jgi:tetratricopeptide (TPR) repeat protein
MKFWFFWFVSIMFYASAVFSTNIDVIPEHNSPHTILFRAHLRKVAELNLKDRFNPSVFVSYSWDSEEYKRRIQTVCEDLERAGIPANQILLDQWANRPNGPYNLHQFMERIPNSDIVMLFGTPELKRKYEAREAHPEDAGIVSHEINLLRNRIVARGVEGLIPAWFEGQFEDSFPISLHHISGRQLDIYFFKLFELLGDIYQTIYSIHQNSIMEIRDKFSVRQSRLRTSSGRTEFYSANGSFPQSLKAYNAFLDRTDYRGLSYLDVIFEELFMNEDEKQFSTLTLCAHIHPQEVTLSGMGGVGKTTLATEFAHKYGIFYDLVYWMRGESRDEFLRSCLSLLNELKIPTPDRGRYAEDAYYYIIIKLINDCLPKQSLLIIDNLEAFILVENLSPPQVHILYTSRNNEWKRKLDIDVLKREESIALLLQLAGLDPVLSDQAGVLAEELGDLPLALAQAAAYIKQQQLSSFETYLEHYRVSQADILAQKQTQSFLNKREAIVMTTWNTTMQKLSPQAKHLMLFLSYVNPNNIPLRLFDGIEESEKTATELTRYSMVQNDNENNVLSIHRLIQFVIRNSLSENQSQEVINLLLTQFDKQVLFEECQIETWPYSYMLAPHLDQVLAYTEPQAPCDIKRKSDLLTILGKILTNQGFLIQAKEKYQHAYDQTILVSDLDSLDVAKTSNNLGRAYGNLGEYTKQKDHLDMTLAIKKFHCTSDYKDLTSALGQGDERVAQRLKFERSLITRENHADLECFNRANVRRCGNTLSFLEWSASIQRKTHSEIELELEEKLHNLGTAYGNLKKYADQKKYFEQALEIYKRTYGLENPETAQALHSLGKVYGNLRLFAEQKKYLQQVLRLYEEIYGTQHSKTADVLYDLGIMYGDIRQIETEKEYLIRALEIYEKAYPMQHPKMAEILHNMGVMYMDFRQYDEAKSYLKKALAIKEKIYGKEHPDVAVTLSHLGVVLALLKEDEEMKSCYDNASIIYEKFYGKKQSAASSKLTNFENDSGELWERIEQKSYFELAISIYEQAYSDKPHPKIAKILQNLGMIYGDLKQYEEQKKYLERALLMFEKIYKREHPEVLHTLYSLGEMSKKLRKYEEQRNYLEQVLVIQEKIHGIDHPYLELTLYELGGAFGNLGQFEDAKNYLKRALTIQEIIYGLHPHVTATLNDLGMASRKLGQYSEETNFLSQELLIREKIYGIEHEGTVETLYNLGTAVGNLGQIEQSKSFFERGLAIQIKLKGMEHPEVVLILSFLKKLSEGFGYEIPEYTLGDIYYTGKGIQQDFDAAFRWYYIAAEQGSAPAESALGTCYFKGNGVAKNLQQAIYRYQKAAEQRDAKGQYNLGVCLINGYGIDKNEEQGISYYQLAAAQGYPSAIKALQKRPNQSK